MLQFLTALPPMVALPIAIACEVVATSMLPKTQQFSQPIPTLITLAGYAFAFFLLSITVKNSPYRYCLRDLVRCRYRTGGIDQLAVAWPAAGFARDCGYLSDHGGHYCD